MVKKKTTAKSSRKSSLGEKRSKKSAASVIFAVVFVAAIFGTVGYNLYLDKQNVNNMKQLLADFEQLESTIEAETGKELTIEADCGSGGKFATFYSCSLRLKTAKWNDDYSALVKNRPISNFESKECSLLSKNSVGFEPEEDNYGCSFIVRPSNQQTSEEIFFDYDTNPGWPL